MIKPDTEWAKCRCRRNVAEFASAQLSCRRPFWKATRRERNRDSFAAVAAICSHTNIWSAFIIEPSKHDRSNLTKRRLHRRRQCRRRVPSFPSTASAATYFRFRGRRPRPAAGCYRLPSNWRGNGCSQSHFATNRSRPASCWDRRMPHRPTGTVRYRVRKRRIRRMSSRWPTRGRVATGRRT